MMGESFVSTAKLIIYFEIYSSMRFIPIVTGNGRIVPNSPHLLSYFCLKVNHETTKTSASMKRIIMFFTLLLSVSPLFAQNQQQGAARDMQAFRRSMDWAGFNRYAEANKEELQHREQMEEIQKRLSAINGKEHQLRKATEIMDKEAAQCQSELDIWMRQFNANHPPVQYNELQETFCTGRDWNAVRTSLRELQMESTLEQANVDNLRKDIVALQSAGVLSTIDEDTTQVSWHNTKLPFKTTKSARHNSRSKKRPLRA